MVGDHPGPADPGTAARDPFRSPVGRVADPDQCRHGSRPHHRRWLRRGNDSQPGRNQRRPNHPPHHRSGARRTADRHLRHRGGRDPGGYAGAHAGRSRGAGRCRGNGGDECGAERARVLLRRRHPALRRNDCARLRGWSDARPDPHARGRGDLPAVDLGPCPAGLRPGLRVGSGVRAPEPIGHTIGDRVLHRGRGAGRPRGRRSRRQSHDRLVTVAHRQRPHAAIRLAGAAHHHRPSASTCRVGRQPPLRARSGS